jgi:hypothetical protein
VLNEVLKKAKNSKFKISRKDDIHSRPPYLMGPVRPFISTPLMKLKRVEPSFQGNSSSQERFLQKKKIVPAPF